MNLNLNLVTGKMDSDLVIYKSIKNFYEYHLEYPVWYTGKEVFNARFLYVVDGRMLPKNPIFQGKCSIICVGMIPEPYQTEEVDFICLKESTDLFLIFNEVMEIFQQYREWDKRLDTVLYHQLDFEKLGAIIYEQFQNPLELLNVGDKYLFRIYDKQNPKNLEYYENFIENSYPPMDELQVIYSVEGYMETFNKKEPELLSNGLYGDKALYANLKVGDRYVGRLIVSDTYHKIQSLHYSLIQYLALKLTETVDASNTSVVINSSRLEKILLQLIYKKEDYHDEMRQYLERKGWKRHDQYQCVMLRCTEPIRHNRQLTSHAVYLSNMMTDCYPLVVDGGILAVFHQTGTDDKEHRMERLKLFCQVEKYVAGYSDLFSDFAEIWVYYHQAQEAMHMIESQHERVRYFSDSTMAYIYKLCLEKYPKNFYLSQQLQALLDYDLENQTEMFKTLKIYLQCGLNVSKALSLLYIHRSTFNYRIEKIQKILGKSLQDYHTRHYLQFAIGLMEYQDTHREKM